MNILENLDFKPKLFSSLVGYNRQTFMSDLMAGIIVGIVALPLAIAFSIASGVSPEKGIITAVVGGFIISFLGGSKVQIGGPTGAFIVIVYGIVQNPQYGIMGLIIATIIAGIILVILGVFKLGTIIKYIPYPIIVGFTSGIAVTIFSSQIVDLFGLNLAGESVPADFLSKWILYFRNITTVNIWITIASLISIAIIIIAPRFIKKIPGSLIAILIVTILVYILREYAGIHSIATIGDRFSINSELPDAHIPVISWTAAKDLLPIAITIALLGGIESLLSATVADGVTGDRHNSNTELIAQGVANIITPLFGGIPATGAIARTMTNINNGGKTPIAGIVHAIVLLLILLFLMPLVNYIPMACLAGVLVIVAYNMSEWRTFRWLMKGPKTDVTVLLVTFFLTVIFDLTIAIQVGIVIACLFFMRRVMETSNVAIFRNEMGIDNERGSADEENLVIPDGVEVYEINGPYFFGIANKFEEQMIRSKNRAKVRIIRMRKIPFIDSTGLYNFSNFCKMSQREGSIIVLSGVNNNVHHTLHKANFYDIIGEENICSNIYFAMNRAKEIIEQLSAEEKEPNREE